MLSASGCQTETCLHPSAGEKPTPESEPGTTGCEFQAAGSITRGLQGVGNHPSSLGPSLICKTCLWKSVLQSDGRAQRGQRPWTRCEDARGVFKGTAVLVAVPTDKSVLHKLGTLWGPFHGAALPLRSDESEVSRNETQQRCDCGGPGGLRGAWRQEFRPYAPRLRHVYRAQGRGGGAPEHQPRGRALRSLRPFPSCVSSVPWRRRLVSSF